MATSEYDKKSGDQLEIQSHLQWIVLVLLGNSNNMDTYYVCGNVKELSLVSLIFEVLLAK